MTNAAERTRAFRNALGAFLTGVTVVTTRDGTGEPRGLTANSFSSVSLDPPMVLVCIAKSASSHAAFRSAGNFAVSILSGEQMSVSILFASRAADKFSRVAWRQSALGSPLIDGAVSWFDCTTQSIIDAGDHSILLGSVQDFGYQDAPPLGYCRGKYVEAAAVGAAKDAHAERTEVGAIVERNGQILLVTRSDGTLSLPVGTRLGPETDPKSLKGVLAGYSLKPSLEFLFAVYEDNRAEDRCLSIFYRGTAIGTPTAGAKFYPLGAIGWDRIGDPAVRAMLQRYEREKLDNAFGIYVGTAAEGHVRGLAHATSSEPNVGDSP